MFSVILESEEFGETLFQYATLAEAQAGYKREVRRARLRNRRDGIQSRVMLVTELTLIGE
jgi:hypothetical protein